MNILVTGANGQLGMSLRKVSERSAHRYIFTDVNQYQEVDTVHLDITDRDSVDSIIDKEKVDIIINCAAYTNVDRAEDDPATADLLNHRAVANLASASYSSGALLIHISTDYVFGAEPYNTPCREEQQGTPTGVYGRTKLLGEQSVIASGCRYIILRTAWLYSEYGRNFVKTMLALTSEKPELDVVFDQAGTPTYAMDLAEAIGVIVESGKFEGNTGIYHYSDEGVCSWYDFAKKIGEYSGHTNCRIRPCHSSEFPSKVHRPSYSVLDKTKIKATFGIDIPYWTDSLKHCLRNMGQL